MKRVAAVVVGAALIGGFGGPGHRTRAGRIERLGAAERASAEAASTPQVAGRLTPEARSRLIGRASRTSAAH